MSLVEEDGEWRRKSPSTFSALRGIVSSIKHGAHASLPAQFCWPYSMLELVAWRLMSHSEILSRLSSSTNPEERFMTAIAWYLSALRDESVVFRRKPWNPVLGECLMCSVQHPNGTLQLIAEQVSHHPPVSAFAITSSTGSLEVHYSQAFADANIADSVVNHHDAAATAAGCLQVLLNKTEVYDYPGGLPPMLIHGSTLGEPIAYYAGEVTITCQRTNYAASIMFTHSGHANTFTGVVRHQGTVIASVEGTCGGHAFVKLAGQQFSLFDPASPRNRIRWVAPDWDQLCSFNVWHAANAALLRSDFTAATDAKLAVEEEQRKRAALHPPAERHARFFRQNAAERTWRPIVKEGEVLFKC